MFLLNSRHGSFTAPPLEAGDPFFRSYGASVPSSLTRFLSRASVYFYHSTCVGFGTDNALIRGVFLGSAVRRRWVGIAAFRPGSGCPPPTRIRLLASRYPLRIPFNFAPAREC